MPKKPNPATGPARKSGKKAAKPATKVATAAVKKASKPPAKKATKKATKTAAKQATKTSATLTPVERLRRICLALPETTEVEAWGEPTFRVKGKIFAIHSSGNNHHGEGREGVWILSVGLEQDMVLRARPDRYFKPPYVGPSGWIGAWLDRNPPWGEIEELIRDGWRRRAPKRVAALLPE